MTHLRPKSSRGNPRSQHRGRAAVAAASAVVVSLLAPLTTTPATAVAPVGQGFNLNPSDLRFILKQIKIAEEHVRTATPGNPCGTLLGSGPDQIPNQNGQGVELPWGLRTVDGSCNNLTPGNTRLGASDNVFPRKTTPDFQRPTEDAPPGFPPAASPRTYAPTTGSFYDSQIRTASNLVVDQTTGNPAAVDAAGEGATPDDSGTLFIQNTAPDVGLSAPYNSLFTLFGQFFDHGLDLTNKGGSGTIFMPLEDDDPLLVGPDGLPGTADDPANPPPPEQRFMVLTRATNQVGPDGVLGTPDDRHEAVNQTSAFVDQSQTYTSHPSHQAFLRQYELNAAGDPVSTGKMLTGADGGLATWESTKAQASAMLGIALSDLDVLNIPLLSADPYGKFRPGPNGFPQMVTGAGPDGVLQTADDITVEGDPTANGDTGVPVPTNVLRTGHAFLDDIAHHAVPFGDHDLDPTTPKQGLATDSDSGTTDDNDFATYDDEMLDAHFVAGDGRINENIGLSAVHQVFHAEHNRLTDDIKFIITNEDPTQLSQWQLTDGSWNGERIFQAARFVTEMEYQHLAFEEFARKVQPQVNLFAGYDTGVDPAIVAEFAHQVYRFGHSMLTETVARTSRSGVNRDIPLLDAFLNPPSYAAGGLTPEQATGDIVRGMTDQYGNEIDEFVTEALRNRLLGLPLDLASLNIARGRDTGIPSLNGARRQFFDATEQSSLAPYADWTDFGLAIRHASSLINFVAAYGLHETITGATTMADKRAAAARLVANDPLDELTPEDSAAFMNGTGPWANQNGVTTTGLDDVDLWLGGLAEKQAPFGGLLGTSFNYIFETQMENLQDGDRFYYLSRTAGLNMLVQLEGNSFSELITRNTDAVNLPADVFSRPDLTFDLSVQGRTPGTPIVDDPATTYDERTLLTRMTDGTVRYAGELHVVFNGSADVAGDDWGRSSEGDDTLRGNDGDDRFEGGAGNDGFIGGTGQDILTDTFGDDVLKGGDGNDAMSSGPGFDLNQGGRGSDFIVGGSDPTETFGGPHNDIIFGGDSTDTVFGDDGDDWIEGGGQADLLQGDNGAPFQDDPNTPGHDVINGNGGADDYDSEGGDDIMVAGAGVERNEGMLGFDWVTHKNETSAGAPVNAVDDMNVTGLLPPSVEALRDRFDLVEGLSGWNGNDTLRGDDFDAVDAEPGNELDAAGIARVDGLASLLPAGATSFTGGNIIIGGAGDDLIEGRGGDDIIDGDAWLNVQLRGPNLATPDPADTVLFDSMTAARANVFAGRINPGDISIARSIESAGAGSALDTAVYSGPRADYDITFGPNAVTVSHARGLATDGTDRVRNIERLQFTDQTVNVSTPPAPVIGTATAGNASATVTWTAPAADGSPPVNGYEIVVSDGTVITGVASTATSRVVNGLTNGTAYTFRVRATNAVGTGPLSAPSNSVTPTAPVGPQITGRSPDTNATEVAVNTNVDAFFDQAMVAGGFNTGTVTLRNPAGSVIAATVTYNATLRRVRLNPDANLAQNTVYTITLTGGPTAIRSTTGNPLTTTSWSFTTVAPPTPVVVAAVPAPNATNVARGANLRVDIRPAVIGVNGSTYVLTNATTNAVIPGTVTVTAITNGTRAVMNPTNALARNTLYRVSLVGGPAAIRSAAGGVPLASVSWTFTSAP